MRIIWLMSCFVFFFKFFSVIFKTLKQILNVFSTMNSFSIPSFPLKKENSGQMVSFLLSLINLCRMAA